MTVSVPPMPNKLLQMNICFAKSNGKNASTQESSYLPTAAAFLIGAHKVNEITTATKTFVNIGKMRCDHLIIFKQILKQHISISNVFHANVHYFFLFLTVQSKNML